MDLHDYARCDATEIRRLISSGEVATAEVLDAAMRALDAVEPVVNAVVHGPFRDAAFNPQGPLAGVPFAVKDTLAEAGRPLEAGSRLLAGFTANRDSTLAERFRDAGLVSIVRTATPEFAFNVDTAPLVNGPTRNPWDLERSPGGSSGGSAALVAAGAVPMAHGNDAGGSIRVPAAWCGLVGLKPSRGRVPVGPAAAEVAGGFAHEFALTRSVRDAALLLDAVNGPAPGDWYYIDRPARSFVDQLQDPLPRLRIAVHTGPFEGVEPAPEVREAVVAAARVLESCGHQLEEDCPAVRDGIQLEIRRTIDIVQLAATITGAAAATGRPLTAESLESATLACVEHGSAQNALAWPHAMAQVNRLNRVWGRFLDDYDIFVCPTTPTTVPLSGTPDQNDPRYETADGWLTALHAVMPYTPVANVTGQPSISLPLATSGDGLPIGVMLTAQTLREGLLLRVAAQLEEAMPWAQARPSHSVGADR